MIPPLFGKQEVGIWRVKKHFPTIWGTYMKLVTKYQISAINSCWEKCDEKCAYMFNVYKNQLSWQTGSRNLTGPKTLPTIWHTYMKLVTKYQISAINSYWEKCAEKYLGWTTERGYNKHDCRLYKQRHHSSLSTNGQEFLHMFSNWKKKKTFFYNYFFSLMQIKLFRF